MTDIPETPISQTIVSGSDVLHHPMNLTIMCATTLSATKTFYPGNDTPEFNATFKKSTWQTRIIADLADLLTVLRWCAVQRRVYVVPGQPVSHEQPCKRKSKQPGATFIVVPRGWFAFDIDGLVMPEGYDIVADPQRCIAWAIEVLCRFAPELKGVRLIVQLSSSAGINPLSRKISLHVWGLLAAPLVLSDIKRWALALNEQAAIELPKKVNKDGTLSDARLIDIGPLSSAERIFFTADPEFKMGRKNPIAERWFTTTGDRDYATLNIPAITEETRAAWKAERRNTDWKSASNEIGGAHFRVPIMKAIQRHIRAGRPNEDAFYAELQQTILWAPDGGRSRETIAEYASLKELHRMRDYFAPAWKLAVDNDAALRAAAPPATPEAPIRPLGEGRAALEALAGNVVARTASGEVVNVLADSGVGEGKTTAFTRALAASCVSVSTFAPTRKLRSEIAAKIPDTFEMEGRKQPKEKPLCILSAEAEKLSQAGIKIRKTLCAHGCPKAPEMVDGVNVNPNVCEYLQQHEAVKYRQSAAYTHAHLPLMGLDPKLDRIPDAYLVDESIYGSLFEDVFFDMSEYQPEKLKEMLKPIRNEKQRDYAVATAFAVLTGYPMVNGEPLTDADVYSAITIFKAATPKNFRGDDSLHRIEFGLKAYNAQQIYNVLRLLEQKYELEFSWLARTNDPNGKGFTATFFKPPKIAKGTSLYLLDATANVELAELIWGRKFEVHRSRVEQFIQVSRITDTTASMTALLGRDSRVKKEKASSDQLETQGKRMSSLAGMIDAFSNWGSTLVVGQQKVTGPLSEYPMPPNVELRHFNSLRGSNEFETTENIVILGYQQLELAKAERMRACLRGKVVTMAEWSAKHPDIKIHPDGYPRHPDTGAAFHPDPITEAFRWNACEGEILQCIGRLRPSERWRAQKPVQLLVIGDTHIPGLPAPVELGSWDKVLQHGLKGPALKRHDTRMFDAHLGVSPRARRDMAELSSDLFPNAIAAKAALAREGGIPAEYKALGYRKGGRGKFSIVVSRHKYEEAWWGDFAIGHVSYVLRKLFGDGVEVRHI